MILTCKVLMKVTRAIRVNFEDLYIHNSLVTVKGNRFTQR